MTNTGPISCSEKTKKSTTPARRTTCSSARNEQIPPLCCHKATVYAYVNLNGTCRYLGAKFGTPQADVNYNKLITEWLANGQLLPK